MIRQSWHRCKGNEQVQAATVGGSVVRAGLLGGARAATATRSCGAGSGNLEGRADDEWGGWDRSDRRAYLDLKVHGLEMYSRKKVGISKLHSCGLERRTHRDGFAELAGLFETFGRDVRVNKKSRMHTDKLGWTYRYVVWKMENRYGDVGPGQVQGRQEIERLREQQDNVTGGIWYGKGKSAGVSTCIKNSPGWLETRLDDLPMWSRRGA